MSLSLKILFGFLLFSILITNTALSQDLIIEHVLLDDGYQKKINQMDKIEVDGVPAIKMNNFISIDELNKHLKSQEKNPVIHSTEEDYRYRIYGIDGFYAYKHRRKRTEGKDNSWHEMNNGHITEDGQVTFDEYLPDIVAPNNIRDAARIRFIRDKIAIVDTSGNILSHFICSQWDTIKDFDLPPDSIKSFRLADMVLTAVDSLEASRFDYQLISSDGYDGKGTVYDWERIRQGYWLWEAQTTDFEKISTSENKVKDLCRIQLCPMDKIIERKK